MINIYLYFTWHQKLCVILNWSKYRDFIYSLIIGQWHFTFSSFFFFFLSFNVLYDCMYINAMFKTFLSDKSTTKRRQSVVHCICTYNEMLLYLVFVVVGKYTTFPRITFQLMKWNCYWFVRFLVLQLLRCDSNHFYYHWFAELLGTV